MRSKIHYVLKIDIKPCYFSDKQLYDEIDHLTVGRAMLYVVYI